jgi:hypothetical protein
LSTYDFADPIPLDQLIGDVAGLLRQWSLHVRLSGPISALLACITSHRTQPSDIDILVEELERAIRAR